MVSNVPPWAAQRNGLPGNLDAVNDPGGINQFLGDHPLDAFGYGNPIATPTGGGQGWFWRAMGNSDWAQKFTMSGTAIGRVTVPVQYAGNAADLLVSLCPDNGGAPNLSAPMAQTKVPAALITNLTAPSGLTAGGPLAHPSFNTLAFTNYAQTEPWISPAATVNGSPNFYATVTSGNYTIFAGGEDTTASAYVSIVNTVQYNGSGAAAKPFPQPGLPVATGSGMLTATIDTLVYMGGQTGTGTPTSAVWTASWNPNTGTVGAWSSQASLPAALTQGAAASWTSSAGAEYVYCVGGSTSGSSPAPNAVSTIYMASLQNGQLGSWQQATSLPQALLMPYAAVIGDWLIVAGGVNTSTAVQSTTYYAQIRPDGSLSAFKNGPSMVGPSYGFSAGWCLGITDSAVIVYGGAQTATGTVQSSPYLQVLPVNDLGVASAWTAWQMWSPGERATSAFSDGNGNWSIIGYNINNTYLWNAAYEAPMLSVPINASGLTSGNPYWIVLQQYQSGSAQDYLSIGFVNGAYSGNGLSSARYAQSWASVVNGWSIPVAVYDTTPSPAPIHTAEDLTAAANGVSVTNQRWSQLVYNDTGLLQGFAEVTLQPNNPLNSNPTFTSGVSPWTAVNGTITQSSAQTHGGFAFSGLLTPTGGFSQAYALSEYLPVDPGSSELYGHLNWYVASGWLYSPTGWASTSLSVNWYDSGQGYLSTSSATVSLAAASWTQVTNYFPCPAGAAYAALVPTESGTPGASNLLYMSNVCLIRAPESVPALASVAQVTYPTPSQPNAPSWPPTGVVQFA